MSSLNKFLAAKYLLLAPALTIVVSCGGGSQPSTVNSETGGGSTPVETPSLLPESITASHMVDIDLDGDIDLILGGDESADDFVLVNDGTGVFSINENALPNHYLGVDGSTINIISADFDQDGFIDLLTTTTDVRDTSVYETSQIHLYFGRGNGTFSDGTSQIADSLFTGEWPTFIRVGDYDLDGNLDFLVTTSGGPVITIGGRIYLNDGAANFTPAAITFTDAETTYTDDHLIWESDGNVQVGRGSDRNAVEVLVGDLNNDGNLDLFAPLNEVGAMATFINQSTPGNLQFNVVFTVDPVDPFSLTEPLRFKNGALLDINNDGFLDVAGSISISGQNDVTVPVYTYINDGDGTFTQGANIAGVGVEHAREWLVDDFNQDGFSDLFVADHGYDSDPFPGEQNLLVLNNGAGMLVDRTETNFSTFSGFTHGATSGDVNGDGFPDLFLNNLDLIGTPSSDEEARLWINNGDGTFSAEDLNL